MSWIQSDLQQSQSSYVPPEWGTGSDAEIVEALEKHYAGEVDLTEYWSVGDGRTVSLSAINDGTYEPHSAQDIKLILTNIGGKYLSDGTTECTFQVDLEDCLKESGAMYLQSGKINRWANSSRRTWCNDIFYNAIPSTLQPIFKEFINQTDNGNGEYSTGIVNTTDYFALRAEIEIFGSCTYSASGEGSQIEYYATSANRKKTIGSSIGNWWLRSPWSTDRYQFININNQGLPTLNYSNTERLGIAPFGVI